MTSNRKTARQFLANEIRLAREAKGISREELAKAVHVSEALIRAWEAGRRVPQSQDIPRVEEALGTNGYIKRLRDDLVISEPVPEYMGRWREIEDNATSLLWFQPLIVPGLLQTSDYARQIIVNSGRLVDDIDEQIEERVARQKILDSENALTFVAILDQSVLYQLVGNTQIMCEQLTRLLEVAQQPNVSIQVVEADTGAYPGLAGAFGIAAMDGQEYAYVDDAFSGDVLEDPVEVAAMKRVWLTIAAEARSARQSIEIIRKAIERWAQ